MHELGVTQNILQIALEHAEKAGARKICCINLMIGALSGIIHESVQFYFDFVSKETMAEGAHLVFKKLPVSFRCPSCGKEFALHGDEWACPACQSPGPEILTGREFFMESIEVE